MAKLGGLDNFISNAYACSKFLNYITAPNKYTVLLLSASLSAYLSVTKLSVAFFSATIHFRLLKF